ncbi:NAD(P)-dependent malic enzyme [Carboxydothermus hydrogenoformans]|uniref:NAD-dependent malic enzyme n=1 Tax=Carboxydothermus hydrogenoformans (strain ATCC BAA-161 / DSM 6008 / Z-2901) TaxID=246194 RepID=Q3ACD3_CARHZ|nr:malic enzyme-like NAD(P)-binding protein [Carboxydothermus hydrogenoformans]ABB16194.1 NAD-dependent malic enzyme [Carboxydothermus hydrogenoformans Z-2901]
MADFKAKALELHKKFRGKIEVKSKVPAKTAEDLSLAYTPGVAEPCKLIAENKDLSYEYTSRWNMVAVVSDGTAVLGLGDIGPYAAMPVMEGKALLFKEFAGVDAFPICLDTKDPDKIVEVVKLLEPTFGGINLEDIAAPNCFYIEERLKKETSIPIFHDDQHGTAIVTLAALINALKIVNKDISKIKVVVNGAGASATAVSKLIMASGVKNLIMCDSKGIIYRGRQEGMNKYKEELAQITNPENIKGTLKDALKGADVFIGLSKAKQVTEEMVKSMNKDAIVFAMANPEPEIYPDEAKRAGARIVATGRSDFPNQVNNVLAFPGVFRGALDVRATDISEKMKIAASYAISSLVAENELNEDYILPKAFDARVASTVAREVAKAALEEGIARIKISPDDVFKHTLELLEKSGS